MNGTHPLAAWLEKAGESRASFARRITISESHLSLILSWDRSPSLGLAARIENATGKKVLASSMVKVDRSDQPAGASQ